MKLIVVKEPKMKLDSFSKAWMTVKLVLNCLVCLPHEHTREMFLLVYLHCYHLLFFKCEEGDLGCLPSSATCDCSKVYLRSVVFQGYTH